MSYLFTYFAFLLVDSLYLCQFITCLFLNKVWGDLIVFHNLLRTSFHPEHCGAKNPGLIMAYIAATLNPEILKNFPGPVRVGKKKSGSGRVAGTRQGLISITTVIFNSCRNMCNYKMTDDTFVPRVQPPPQVLGIVFFILNVAVESGIYKIWAK